MSFGEIGPYLASLAAFLTAMAALVKLLSRPAPAPGVTGGAGTTAGGPAQSVTVGGGLTACDRAAEHSQILQRLAEVQQRQIVLDEQMGRLLERVDARMAVMERAVADLATVERESVRAAEIERLVAERMERIALAGEYQLRRRPPSHDEADGDPQSGG